MCFSSWLCSCPHRPSADLLGVFQISELPPAHRAAGRAAQDNVSRGQRGKDQVPQPLTPLGSPFIKAVTNETTSHRPPDAVRGLAGLPSHRNSGAHPRTATAKCSKNV